MKLLFIAKIVKPFMLINRQSVFFFIPYLQLEKKT
jgi:hypothetical protein